MRLGGIKMNYSDILYIYFNVDLHLKVCRINYEFDNY